MLTLTCTAIATVVFAVVIWTQHRCYHARIKKANSEYNEELRRTRLAAEAEFYTKTHNMTYVRTHHSYADDADEYSNGVWSAFVISGNGTIGGRRLPIVTNELPDNFRDVEYHVTNKPNYTPATVKSLLN